MANEYLNNHSFEKMIKRFQKLKRTKNRCELVIQDFNQSYEKALLKNENAQKHVIQVSKEEEYRLACIDMEESQNDLTTAFYLLAQNIAAYRINRYSGIDADDAVQEAVLTCFERVHRFNPDKGKAFAYMTTCIINHFRYLYRTNQNYMELKRRFGNHLQDQNGSSYKNGKNLTIPSNTTD